jgi:hypothetical protein
MVQATFRDHNNMEPKQYADIVTVEDVWMWLNYVFVPKTYYDTYDNGEPRNASDAHTLLISNRLTKVLCQPPLYPTAANSKCTRPALLLR